MFRTFLRSRFARWLLKPLKSLAFLFIAAALFSAHDFILMAVGIVFIYLALQGFLGLVGLRWEYGPMFGKFLRRSSGRRRR